MESFAPMPTTMPTILCPLCGVAMRTDNAANICPTCLSTRVDASEGITKQVVIYDCRGCHRYLRNGSWIKAALESKELLSLCLGQIKAQLSKVRVVDANFVWTEPHSRRLKVKLTVQKEVLGGVKVQQAFVVEYVIQNQQCTDCQKSYTEHTWEAVVQVQQHVDHKRTFFYLEQTLLKYNAHKDAMAVDEVQNGLNFYFGARGQAVKFQEFLSTVVPTKFHTSKRLISADLKSNTARHKFTFSVNIVPICKDDLVCLPKRLAMQCSNIGQLALCYRVTNHVYLVDPRTLQIAELNAEKYWHYGFRPLLTSARMVELIVLDVVPVPMTAKIASAMARRKKTKRRGKKRGGAAEFEPLATVPEGGFGAGTSGASVASGGLPFKGLPPASAFELPSSAASTTTGSLAGSSVFGSRMTGATGFSATSTVTGGPKNKYLLAEVEVARSRDFGVNDTRFTVLSHLGNVLKVGDTVMGYDLTTAVYNDSDAAPMEGKEMPEILLVKKVYPRKKKRAWKLKRMKTNTDGKADAEAEAKQYEDFLQDLEDDRHLRSAVNVYKDPTARRAPVEDVDVGGEDAGEAAPSIALEELLDGLHVDGPAAGAGASAVAAMPPPPPPGAAAAPPS